MDVMIKRLVMLLPEIPHPPRWSHVGHARQIEAGGRQGSVSGPELRWPRADWGRAAC